MFCFRVIAEDEITITQCFLITLTCYIGCSKSLQTRKLSLVQRRRQHIQNLSQRETDSKPLKLMEDQGSNPSVLCYIAVKQHRIF